MAAIVHEAALRRGLCHNPDTRIYLAPRDLLRGASAAPIVQAGQALAVAGQALSFETVEVLLRDPERILSARSDARNLRIWAPQDGQSSAVANQLARISAPRSPIAGLTMDGERPMIMGILNVTPDSFSDGGDHVAPEDAIIRGKALIAAGANLLDIGGESTRPGAEGIAPDVEAGRVVPVIKALAETGIPISIDSRNVGVMSAALDAGAQIVNDVSALTHDPAAVKFIAQRGVPMILMHMRGDPKSMQDAPVYDCAPLDVFDWLEARIAACVAAGIEEKTILVDPGIGFGKTTQHNVEILARLSLLHGLGRPIVLGASRKRFIANLTPGEPAAKRRVPGSTATAIKAAEAGVQIIRVHDVAETVQALAVWRAMTDAV